MIACISGTWHYLQLLDQVRVPLKIVLLINLRVGFTLLILTMEIVGKGIQESKQRQR
jgi:hypothetical protein